MFTRNGQSCYTKLIRGFPELTLTSERDQSVRIYRETWDGSAWDYLVFIVIVPIAVCWTACKGCCRESSNRVEKADEENGNIVSEAEQETSCFGQCKYKII